MNFSPIFFFPPEWHSHEATWLTVPHNNSSWQGDKLSKMLSSYVKLIQIISQGEKVRLVVNDESIQKKIQKQLIENQVDESKIEYLIHPTNDAWCRDHGPSFVINVENKQKKIINWGYNAWGGKYPPFSDDDDIPKAVSNYLNIELIDSQVIMEGGSVEFNGAGTLLTTRSCLLNPNRNPHLNKTEIEKILEKYYGVKQILWLESGIVGDDTDGHIDDITRFVSEDTVLTMIETRKSDENYAVLQKNKSDLKKMRLPNGKPLTIIELPMPPAVIIDGFRTPASYANFYICNTAVIVPTFRTKTDDLALSIISQAFKNKKVIGLDSYDIIWGQGSFHCLTQQEPLV